MTDRRHPAAPSPLEARIDAAAAVVERRVADIEAARLPPDQLERIVTAWMHLDNLVASGRRAITRAVDAAVAAAPSPADGLPSLDHPDHREPGEEP